MVLRSIVLSRVQNLALILFLARDVWKVWVVAPEPEREHEVLGVHYSRRSVAALDSDVPLVVRILNRLYYGRLRPDVQLKRLSVVLEPPGEFLRGSVYRPRRREPALASTRPGGHERN